MRLLAYILSLVLIVQPLMAEPRENSSIKLQSLLHDFDVRLLSKQPVDYPASVGLLSNIEKSLKRGETFPPDLRAKIRQFLSNNHIEILPYGQITGVASEQTLLRGQALSILGITGTREDIPFLQQLKGSYASSYDQKGELQRVFYYIDETIRSISTRGKDNH